MSSREKRITIILTVAAFAFIFALFVLIVVVSEADTATGTTATNSLKTISKSGGGSLKTEPFVLSGGNYRVSWQASTNLATGCFHSGWLMSADAGNNTRDLLVSADVKTSKSGETTAYNVVPGQYYLDMTSGCEWSVTLTSQ